MNYPIGPGNGEMREVKSGLGEASFPTSWFSAVSHPAQGWGPAAGLGPSRLVAAVPAAPMAVGVGPLRGLHHPHEE